LIKLIFAIKNMMYTLFAAVIPLLAVLLIIPVTSGYVAPPYDPTAKVFLPPDAPRNMLPYVHRE
jgi:hypothetical protein